MGSPKASLAWHGSTLLRRVTGLAQRTVDGPVVVVRAPGQELPELSPSIEVVCDAREGRGPLQGLAAGLAAIGERAEVAFVSSTDAPLLHPAFIRRVIDALSADVDVVLPEIHGFRQPLSAAYRSSLLPEVEALIAADKLKPAFLFERCRVLRLDDAAMLRDGALAALDPDLASVTQPQRAQRLRAGPRTARARDRGSPLRDARDERRPACPARARLDAWVSLPTPSRCASTSTSSPRSTATRSPAIASCRWPPGDTVGFMVADAGG